jgi:hypothetical protein
MDLSIRVIALILCATCVASHQDTHTYRLSKFLKSTPQTSTNTRQQQRSEIMKITSFPVKSFSTLFTSTFSSRTSRNARRFRRGEHYKDLARAVNTLS